jgi:molybdenum cofactor cytidylyltransferase
MKSNFKIIPVIILAAGDSKRMGVPKGIMDYYGKPFLSRQIECLLEISFSEIIVVLGKDKDLYQEKISELRNCKVILNPDPEKGQFSSLKYGLQEVSESQSSGVFILPLDVPCPKKEVWKQLGFNLNLFDASVLIPQFEGKRGHPVLLSDEFKNYLLTCDLNTRLDHEIRKKIEQGKAKIISVNDNNITLNLNTPEDWEAFKVKQ